MQRQDHQVNEIRQDIKSNDGPGAKSERQRQIAAGVFYFGGGEGDVVPRVGGKERAGLSDSDHDQSPDEGKAATGHINPMDRAERRILPEVTEVLRHYLRVRAYE